MNKIANFLFLLLTTIQITFLFVLVKFAGISSSAFNSVTIAYYLLFIVYYHKVSVRVFLRPFSLVLFLLTLLVPLFVTFINNGVSGGEIDLRAFGVRFLLFLIYLSIVIYGLNSGLKTLNVILILSIVIAFLGITLSLIFPSVFLVFSIEHGANSVTSGRAFGFYLQPNTAAAALVAMYLSYIVLRNKNTGLLLSSVIFIGILMTASRSGIFLFILIYMLSFVYLNRMSAISAFLKRGPLVVFVGIFAVLMLFATINIYESFGTKNDRDFSAADRLTAITQVASNDSTSTITNDSDSRIGLALSYIDYILKRPFGYGLAASEKMRAQGILLDAPHNQFIQVSFEAGIIGLVVYLYFLFSIPLSPGYRNWKVIKFSLFAFIFLYGLVSNNILDDRMFYFLFGVFVVGRELRPHAD